MKITPPNLTPGPWHDPGTNRIHAPGSVVCSVPRGINEAGEWEEKHPEIGANAKAIAAMHQLLAALEFYANPENWKEQETGIGMAPSECEDDYGSKAQEALTLAGYTITP